MRKIKEHHGDTKTDLYKRWSSMINRCKPGRFSKTYFDKGITVCEHWKSYNNFKKWALSNGFEKHLELDRINNAEGYSPDNCRFVSKIINTSNRSNTIFIEYNGERISLTLFAIKNNIPKNRYNTIRRRIKNGWDVQSAIELPLDKRNSEHGYPKKVFDTLTGDIYNSINDAASKNNISPTYLSSMLNGKRPNKTNLRKID